MLISHAPDSDSWWNTIKNAIKQADEDFNVETDYRNPPNGDIADMSRLIEQAAARNYDGVIVTIADFDVLKSSIGKVTAKKIPLVTINSGTEEQSAQLGAIMHVGQPEYVAGKAAGEKAKAAGVKSFLCVNHIATNTVSFDRCRGFAEAIGVDYKTSTHRLRPGSDRDPVEGERVSAQPSEHRRDPDARTDARLRHAEGGARRWASQARSTSRPSTSPTTSPRAIQDGTIQFAIDQQPYLQGYIPVAVLAIVKKEHTTDPVKIRQILRSQSEVQGTPRNLRSRAVVWAEEHPFGPGFHHQGKHRQGRQVRRSVPLMTFR